MLSYCKCCRLARYNTIDYKTYVLHLEEDDERARTSYTMGGGWEIYGRSLLVVAREAGEDDESDHRLAECAGVATETL